VTLFPMLHIGAPEFFEKVYADAFSHDTVLVEGVNSPIARRWSKAYRAVARAGQIGLALQPPYPSQAECGAQIILADLSGREFDEAWRSIPLWLRLFLRVAVPAMAYWGKRNMSRLGLSLSMPLDDLPRSAEILALTPHTMSIERVIVEARDARLLAHLSEQLDAPETAAKRIAIVYGAAHMRAALRELLVRRSFRIEQAEWMTVFEV
jgi:hypothetical protein